MQQTAVFHTILRPFVDQLSFQFKLYDGNCLMHFPVHQRFFLASFLIRGIFQYKLSARIIAVSIHGKCCKRNHIDAITILNQIQIPIPDKYPVWDSPPLDIKRMILFQLIHNPVR